MYEDSITVIITLFTFATAPVYAGAYLCSFSDNRKQSSF